MDCTLDGRKYADIWKRMCEAAGDTKTFDAETTIYQINGIIFYGYDFGLNSTTVDSLCRDKQATFELLRGSNIATPDCYLINGYDRSNYEHRESILQKINMLLEKYGEIVVKPVRGRSGYGVSKIKNIIELEYLLSSTLRGKTFVAMPLLKVKCEYRIIMANLNGIQILLTLTKTPLFITGDGVSTIKNLIDARLSTLPPWCRTKDIYEEAKNIVPNWEIIPALQEKIIITWRLNQSMGSNITCEPLEKNVIELAEKAFTALNLNFGCIDIIELDDSNITVLEANTSIVGDMLHYCSEIDLQNFMKNVVRFHTEKKHIDINIPLIVLPDNYILQKIKKHNYHEKSDMMRKIYETICQESNYKVEFYCDNYITVVNKAKYIIDYDYGLNNMSAMGICRDKSATAAIMIAAKIPCVPHILIKGNKGGMVEIANQYVKLWKWPIVVKPAGGSNGIGVKKISDPIGLERYVLDYAISGFTVSPYVEIINEYRVVCLDGQVILIYKKNLPVVTGNGTANILKLIIEKYSIYPYCCTTLIKSLDTVELFRVPIDGENVNLSWRHNLCHGAFPTPVNTEYHENLMPLALKVVTALNLRYGAIDIIETTDSDKFRVLEVNSTPGFTNFIMFYGEEFFTQVLRPIIYSLNHDKKS